MTVKQLCEKAELKTVIMPNGEREVYGAYCGDLLSWVMGRASSSNAWITIMSNVNVAAVASLADLSCVILAEGVLPDQEVIKAAELKEINILSSDKDAYSLCGLLGKFI